MLRVLTLGTRMKLNSEWNLWEVGEGGWLRALRRRNFRKGKQHSNFSKYSGSPGEIIGRFANAVQKCVDRGLGLPQFRGGMIDSLVSKTMTGSRGWTGMKVATLYFVGEECLLS
jgi:hypothetical protein